MNLLTQALRYQKRQPPPNYNHISGSEADLSASIERLNARPTAGLMSYKQYVTQDQGGYWSERKAVYRGYFGGICQICRQKKMVTLHHTPSGYQNVGKENIAGDLIPVCAGCHKNIHKSEIELEAARKQHINHVWRDMENL